MGRTSGLAQSPRHLTENLFSNPQGGLGIKPKTNGPGRLSESHLQFAQRSNLDVPLSPLANGSGNPRSTLTNGNPTGFSTRLENNVVEIMTEQRNMNLSLRKHQANSRILKRAVLIGATYSGTKGIKTLKGNVQDVSMLFDLLTFHLGFKPEDIWVLTDEPRAVVGAAYKLVPTRENIMNSMKWLVRNSRKGEELVFSFSGHGHNFTSDIFDQAVQDEGILPSDYPVSDAIKAGEIHDVLVQGLADGATLTSFLNCRHSAKMMCLPFVHVAAKTGKRSFVLSEQLEERNGQTFITTDVATSTAWPFTRIRRQRHEIRRKVAQARREKLAASCFANGTVICISSEIQADLQNSPQQTAANVMIFAFVRYLKHCVSKREKPSYATVLCAISSWMAARGEQQFPQLSSSHNISPESVISFLSRV